MPRSSDHKQGADEAREGAGQDPRRADPHSNARGAVPAIPRRTGLPVELTAGSDSRLHFEPPDERERAALRRVVAPRVAQKTRAGAGKGSPRSERGRRVRRLGPQLSDLKRRSYESSDGSGDDPLQRIYADVIEDSCHISLTSKDVHLELLERLA